ncbi:MAG: hypothetical protein O7F76_03310 [Planctomycetota bacterium]|nr:hypothetical protein [Planctomycetota bacterium]
MRTATKKATRVQQNVLSGTALGVGSVPTFFAGSEMVIGFRTIEELARIIDRHLNNGG